jgi:hypothetical protein
MSSSPEVAASLERPSYKGLQSIDKEGAAGERHRPLATPLPHERRRVSKVNVAGNFSSLNRTVSPSGWPERLHGELPEVAGVEGEQRVVAERDVDGDACPDISVRGRR